MAKLIQAGKKEISSARFAFSIPQGRLAYALIIFCFAFALYFNSIFNNYNLDDELVTNNQALTSQGWKVVLPDFAVFHSDKFADSCITVKLKYFVPEVFRSVYYQDKSGYKYEYRPLVQASFAIEHALFAEKINSTSDEAEYRDNPHTSHFINGVLYALTCALLFVFLMQLFSSYNIIFSFIATLLFVAHPIHTEVVASIKNRDEILALLFALISGICAIKFTARKKLIYLLLLGLAFLLSLLAKRTAITFAVLIPLSLIMFSDIPYTRLMLVAGVMAGLAAFYSGFFFVKEQVALFVILPFTITIAYAALHYKIVGQYIKLYLNKFKTSRNINAGSTAETLDFRFLSNPLVVLFAGVCIISMMALATFAANQNWYALSCILAFAFALAYLYAGAEGKIILITPITLTLLLQLYAYGINFITPQVVLVIFLSHLMFSGNKYARVVAAINYVVFIIAGHFVFHTVILYLFLAPAFLGFYYPRLIVVSLLGFVVSVFHEGSAINGYFLHGHKIEADIIRWPLFQLAMFFSWRNKQKLVHLITVVAMPLVLTLLVLLQPVNQKKDLMVNVHHAVGYFNHFRAVDPTPVQSVVRPLKYAEYPVAKTDSYNKRFGMAAEVLGRYLKLILLPYPMSYYYGYAYITPKDITQPLPLFALLLYILIGIVAVALYWRKPLIAFALLFYLISISVYTNLIAPLPGVMADRFLLVPSIGFCLIMALGLFAVFKQDIKNDITDLKGLSRPFKYTFIGILLIYSAVTIARNTNWKDHLTLYRHDIANVENSSQAQNLLGVELLANASQEQDAGIKKQLAEEAVIHFKRAIEIYPDFINASFDLARTYQFLGRPDEAYIQFARTINIDSAFNTPRFYMAVIQQKKGNYTGAIELYEKYISKSPLQLQAYTNLSDACFQDKQYSKVVDVNLRALKIAPGSFNSILNIGKAYMAENKTDSALLYFQMAHAVKPADSEVNNYISGLSKK